MFALVLMVLCLLSGLPVQAATKTPPQASACSIFLKSSFHVDIAESKDINEMAKLDLSIWGEKMAASELKLLSRIETFPQGQLVARFDGKILGFVNAQKISNAIEYLNDSTTWPSVTGHGFIDESHVADGKVLFLINLTVDPSVRKFGFSRSQVGGALIKAALELAKADGITHVEGITRLNGLKNYLTRAGITGDPSDSDVKGYIQRVAAGELRDPAMSFHLDQGAQVAGPIKEAMPDDDDSLNWGALIVYRVP